MRSGSSAEDGRGWSPAQHPYSGRGPQSDREDVSFGPDNSWPAGFRQMEFDSGEYRQLVESSYAPDGRGPNQHGRDGHGPDGYEHVNPRHGGGHGHRPAPRNQSWVNPAVPGNQSGPGYQPDGGPGRGYQAASGYRQPAMDDYGYGDPGYADPSYDGPRDHGGHSAGAPHVASAPNLPALPAPVVPAPVVSAPALPAPVHQGYQPPWPGDSMEPDPIYPVTGAQEIYREPAEADHRAEQRPADPRLAGLRYDELRYDDSGPNEPRYGESSYDEPLDDEAWYAELRRSGPAFPQRPSAPGGPADPGGPGQFASAMGGRPQAGYDRSPGYPQVPGNGNGSGSGPRLGMAPGTGPVMTRALGPAQPAPGSAPGGFGPGGFGAQPVPGTQPVFGTQPALGTRAGFGTPRPEAQANSTPRPVPGAQPASAYQAAPTLSPPTPVGLLTPPVGSRFEARADASQTRESAVITGPDTAAWDAAPDADLASLEEYWQEDDGDGGSSVLLEEFDAKVEVSREAGTQGMEPPRRGIGRRRGRSSDHRLWLGLGGVVVVAAAAIFGIIKFELPSSSSGPAHELVTPAAVGSYKWVPNLEKNSDLGGLIKEFRTMLGSSATAVVGREYESATAGASAVTEAQIVLFIGAHVPNQSPSGSLHSFIEKYPGAQVISTGVASADAACVENAPGTADSKATCARFDNDTMLILISPTMNTSQLAPLMRTFQPHLEPVAK
ncbi:MAG: hypothetical protein JO345_20140 [Streptosporangiaceae bacterium]|nr:hypothetical protein [Streptosporangiaceae bacterium]